MKMAPSLAELNSHIWGRKQVSWVIMMGKICNIIGCITCSWEKHFQGAAQDSGCLSTQGFIPYVSHLMQKQNNTVGCPQRQGQQKKKSKRIFSF
jgi:hypothetical protein